MSFLPVLHPLLLVPLALAGLGVAIWALAKARSAGERVSWAVRVLLVAACAVLAFRPGVPDGASKSVSTNVDVIIALDNTTSMLAEDWDGEGGNRRIDGVESDIRALIEEYPGARFSLIAFDNSAQVRLPLTTDTSALMSSLEVMTPPPTDTSNGSSVSVAAPVLKESLENAQETEGRSRLVFYLGDGEQTAEELAETFADSADLLDGGAVLGYGTAEGGQMKRPVGVGEEPSDDWVQAPDGGPAVSVIDEAALETIADELGVGYEHRTGKSGPDLPPAPEETTTTADADTPGARTELSWIVALVVAGLLAIEIGLDSARISRTLALTRRKRTGKERT
ncbi:MAG: VWA domain-containing protein [Microbacterium sp.]